LPDPSIADSSTADPSARSWLNLQISFGLGGGAVWFLGVMLAEDFISGLGGGLVLAALLLRLARTSGQDEQ